jgi:hypothetical protein
MLILYYKDIRNLMGVQILANKVDGRDGKRGENVIAPWFHTELTRKLPWIYSFDVWHSTNFIVYLAN